MNAQVVFIPFLTKQRFAASVGVTEDVVEKWQRLGYVKIFKIGRRALIDMRHWLSSKQEAEA
jgi:hypothetical protein